MTDLHTAERDITAHRDTIAGRLAGLRARLAELAGRRAEAIRDGEFDVAETLHGQQVQVEQQADQLARLAGELDEAHHEASAARQRQDWQEQRDQALIARDEHLRTAAQMADRLTELLDQCRETVKAGAAAERSAKDAAGTVHGLDDALDPPAQRGGVVAARPFTPPATPMSRTLQADPLLHQLFSKYL